MWNPTQYLRFGDERAQPFVDLVARIPVAEAALVADLGCGPGALTATLSARFAGAGVIGVDSSPEMIAVAAAHEGPRVCFELADARSWSPPAPLDVLVSNATLQWIDDHVELLGHWMGLLRPGGWFAFQVPGNFDSPSHLAIAEQVMTPRWRSVLDADALERPRSAEPRVYLDRLWGLAVEVAVWETTYLHVLAGPDPVLEWIRATALRPVLARLAAHGPEVQAAFEAELAERLRRAYPPGPYGTVFPFRRVFAVARRPA